MEIRNITIVSTKNQNKYVVSTDATTLRELKSALSAQSIDYDGMTFYEGLSHTELLTDDAILPHDVPYKGNVTNELVFMLTNPNKKIKSGLATDGRQALYETIEELDLKEACIAKYGKNFTQCKNSELMALIEEWQENEEGPSVEKALLTLVDILENNLTIDSEDAEEVYKALGKADEAEASSYTEAEIKNMFKDLV